MDILSEIKDYNCIYISGHIKPDGDCIGSCIALGKYLRKVYPEKTIKVFSEEAPECFFGLDGLEELDLSFSGPDPDVYILLDATPDRMGAGEKLYKAARKTINIDHHISNAEGSGDVNYIVPGASSTAELIYNVIDKNYLDKTIASWIYLGIVHDTGVFKYPSTTPDTMRVVARLMEEGLNCQYLIDKTFYEKTFKQNIASAKIVENSKLYFDGQVIIGSISLNQMKEWGYEKNDFDGVINQLRITTGVEVAVFMYPMNDQTMKVSLRSKSVVDVSAVSAMFGGGGHVRAAGFYNKGSVEDTTKKILEILSNVSFV